MWIFTFNFAIHIFLTELIEGWMLQCFEGSKSFFGTVLKYFAKKIVKLFTETVFSNDLTYDKSTLESYLGGITGNWNWFMFQFGFIAVI